jgi:hypothetical protein
MNEINSIFLSYSNKKIDIENQKAIGLLPQSNSFHSSVTKTNNSRFQNRSKSPDPSILRGMSSNNKLTAGSLTTSDDEETTEASLSSQKSASNINSNNNNFNNKANNNKNGHSNNNRQTAQRQHYNSLSISSTSSSSSSTLPQTSQSSGNNSLNKNQPTFLMSSPPPQLQTSMTVLSLSSQASPGLVSSSLNNNSISTSSTNTNLGQNYGTQLNDPNQPQQQVKTFSPGKKQIIKSIQWNTYTTSTIDVN